MNVAARDEDFEGETNTFAQRWTLGVSSPARVTGSVHSDTIETTAAQLAECNYVGVYPVVGWWRERPSLGKTDKSARYSLIVSISTPATNVDLYTPVYQRVNVPTSVIV